MIDLVNCITWVALIIVLIVLMIKCAYAWIEVKHAIRNKINRGGFKK